MTEQRIPERDDAVEAPEQKRGPVVAINRSIPATSVAVMIFILLVAFACTGVQVVFDMVEANNAPEEIKGKDKFQAVEYPVPASLPSGVAAEVNGVEIPEEVITEGIMTMRENLGLQDQEAWDEWMLASNNSTETIRNRYILYHVNNEIIDQIAEELDIHPTEEEYQETWDRYYSDPEAYQSLLDSLAEQGRTLEEHKGDMRTTTKRIMIGEKYNEGTFDTPEFDEAVLNLIKQDHEEYADATSLDEIDPDLVEQVTAQAQAMSDQQAFSSYVHDFLKRSDVLYSEMGSNLPYKTGADAHYMKEEVKQLLNKNGIFLGEGGIFDDLMANAPDGGDE